MKKLIILILATIYLISCSEETNNNETKDNDYIISPKDLNIKIDKKDFTAYTETADAIECASMDFPLDICIDENRLAVFDSTPVYIDGKCIFPFTIMECTRGCLEEFEDENDRCFGSKEEDITSCEEEDVKQHYCIYNIYEDYYELVTTYLETGLTITQVSDGLFHCTTVNRYYEYCEGKCIVVPDGPDYCE